jgi:hypothetical protein
MLGSHKRVSGQWNGGDDNDGSGHHLDRHERAWSVIPLTFLTSCAPVRGADRGRRADALHRIHRHRGRAHLAGQAGNGCSPCVPVRVADSAAVHGDSVGPACYLGTSNHVSATNMAWAGGVAATGDGPIPRLRRKGTGDRRGRRRAVGNTGRPWGRARHLNRQQDDKVGRVIRWQAAVVGAVRGCRRRIPPRRAERERGRAA